MSVVVSFLFNVNIPKDEIANTLNEYLGFNLKKSSDIEELYDGWLKGFGLSFRESHTLENDGNVNFEDYKYTIGIYGPAGAGTRRKIMVSEILNIGYSICYLFKASGIAVYDLQAKICEMYYKDEDVFDLLLDKPINLMNYYNFDNEFRD